MASDFVLPPMPEDDVEPTRSVFGLQSLLKHVFPSISLPYPGRYAQKAKESQATLYQEVIPGISLQIGRNFGLFNTSHVVVMASPVHEITPYTFVAQTQYKNLTLMGRMLSDSTGVSVVTGNLSPTLSFTLSGQAAPGKTSHAVDITYDGSDFALTFEKMPDFYGLGYMQSISKTFSFGLKMNQQIDSDFVMYEGVIRRDTGQSFSTLTVGSTGVEATYTRLIDERLLLSTEFSLNLNLQSNFLAGYAYNGQVARGSARISGQGKMECALEHVHDAGFVFGMYLKADLYQGTYDPGFGLKLGA
eukprot:TRINITY_DN1604_c0_g1_i1.p1 TRINITY_DN1604_c0_g1~~TRINITY_DN1604_c0_g1_i1.p1  ORF type:complete len:303 (-),score=71.54 TRINITY_DN1604_c0_g1_i1:317-1225(-)